MTYLIDGLKFVLIGLSVNDKGGEVSYGRL